MPEQPPFFSQSPEILRHYAFDVAEHEHGMRLDRFLASRLQEAGVSRERLKRCIREGRVQGNAALLNSPRAPVTAGTRITLDLETEPAGLVPEQGDVRILYRDSSLAVLDKPFGLTVHPCPSCPAGTLVHRLVGLFPELAAMEGFRPGIVHRLDKDTSGLLLVALSDESRLALAALFAERRVRKEYLALLHGVPKEREGTIELPLGRDPRSKIRMAVLPGGKPARSAWRILYADAKGRFSLAAVRIFTGRTHQIRVHMAHMGHPLLGDALYGGVRARADKAPRQMLHAWKLAFPHPFPEPPLPAGSQDREMHFSCPPPEDFSTTLAALLYRPLRVVVTGSPGCGKSTLLEALRTLGLPVFSADQSVRDLYEPGADGWSLLRSRFGRRFTPADNAPVDKAALGAAMRASDALRREVEELLHPLVRHALDAYWRQQEEAGAPLAVAEIPLYLEAGFDRAVGARQADRPLLVGVSCPFAVRQERLARTRGWSEETIAAMESWQLPEEKKMAACAVVLDNTGAREDMAVAATALCARLGEMARERLKREVDGIRRLWLAAKPGDQAKD